MFFTRICLKGFEYFLAKKKKNSYFINILGTFSQCLDILTNNNSIKQDLEFLLNLQSTGTASDPHSWGQVFNFCSVSCSLSQQTKLWSPITPTHHTFVTKPCKFHTIQSFPSVRTWRATCSQDSSTQPKKKQPILSRSVVSPGKCWAPTTCSFLSASGSFPQRYMN